MYFFKKAIHFSEKALPGNFLPTAFVYFQYRLLHGLDFLNDESLPKVTGTMEGIQAITVWLAEQHLLLSKHLSSPLQCSLSDLIQNNIT